MLDWTSQRVGALLLVVLMGLVVGGCWDRRELDDQHFILTLGVDEGPEGGYIVSAQIAVPAVITGTGGAGGSGGGSGGGGSSGGQVGPGLVMTVSDSSILGALNMLETVSDRRLVLAHVKGFFIGDSLARNGMAPVFNALARWRETRGVAYVAIAIGGAQNVLRELMPRIEANPGKYVEEMFISYAHTGLIPHSHFHDVLAEMEIPTRQPLIPLVAVDPVAQDAGREQQSGSSAELDPSTPPPPSDAQTTPGQYPHVGGLPEQFAGSALMLGDRMVGVLDAAETRVALMLRGEFKQALIGIPDPYRPGSSIILDTRVGQKTEVLLHWRGPDPELVIKVVLDADLAESNSDHDWTAADQFEALGELAARVLQSHADAVIAKVQQAGTDVLRAGESLRREFATWDQFVGFDWGRKFPEIHITTEVRVNMRRPGLIAPPVQPYRPGLPPPSLREVPGQSEGG